MAVERCRRGADSSSDSHLLHRCVARGTLGERVDDRLARRLGLGKILNRVELLARESLVPRRERVVGEAALVATFLALDDGRVVPADVDDTRPAPREGEQDSLPFTPTYGRVLAPAEPLDLL